MLAQLKRAQDYMGSFKANREGHDGIIKRTMPTVLPKELQEFQQGIDYQSPKAEKGILDMVDALQINPTVHSLLTQHPGPQAEKQLREVLLYHARSWDIENVGRWWDSAVGEDQVRYGVKVMQFCSYGEGESGPENHRFYWKNVPTLSVSWMPKGRDVDAAFWEYDLPILESDDDYKRDGDGLRPTLDSAGRLGWLADEEDHDSDSGDAGRQLHVIVRDARDPKNKKCPLEGCSHYLRKISIWVGESGNAKEADLLREFDSPFPGCSFFIIAGRESNERDMDRRYRSILFPYYCEIEWHNMLTTLLATMIRYDYSVVKAYIDGSRMQPGTELSEAGPDGTIKIKHSNADEILVIPGELKAWPAIISDHLPMLIQESKERMREFEPNRFTMGQNFEEAKGGTGTANIQATQQAALPYNRLLGQSDSAIQKAAVYREHAIRYWAYAGEDEEYGYKMAGSEAIGAYSVEGGEKITITAKKVEIEHTIVIRTKSETLAEQERAVQLGWFLLSNNQIDQEQYWQDYVGLTDIEGQERRQAKMLLWKRMQPEIMEAAAAMFHRRFEAETGISLAMAGMAGGGMPPPGGQPNGNMPSTPMGRSPIQPVAIEVKGGSQPS